MNDLVIDEPSALDQRVFRHPVGLKIEITEDNLKQIEALAGYGMTLKQIAAVMGMHAGTFHIKKSEDERIQQAIDAGKAKAQGVVAKALFKKAKEGDIGAIKWWEMTRAKRRATLPVGDDGTTAQTININVVRPNED